jgi:hypothetical protein
MCAWKAGFSVTLRKREKEQVSKPFDKDIPKTIFLVRLKNKTMKRYGSQAHNI